MARLHAAAMTTPRPWSSAEFASLLSMPGTFAITDDHALALGRVTLDEAELLTLATAPLHRRRGLGRAILGRFHATAQARGATHALLEVAAGNTAARALYRGAGYIQTGIRPRYYTTGSGGTDDALILCCAL